MIGITDFSGIKFSDVISYSYSTESLVGDTHVSPDQLTAGTVIAFKTDEGRYGKFRVDALAKGISGGLTISYIIYP